MVTGSSSQQNRQQASDGSTSGGAYQLLCGLLMGIAPGTKKTLSAEDVIGHLMSERISGDTNAGDNTTGSCTTATNDTNRRKANGNGTAKTGWPT